MQYNICQCLSLFYLFASADADGTKPVRDVTTRGALKAYQGFVTLIL